MFDQFRRDTLDLAITKPRVKSWRSVADHPNSDALRLRERAFRQRTAKTASVAGSKKQVLRSAQDDNSNLKRQ